MLEVDWDLVKQWNVSQRYSAVGVLTRREVERRLNETEKAYHQIVDFTVLDRLVEIEEALTKRFGLFNFFGFVEDRRTNGWELWYSMWARHNGQALVHSDVEKALAERLDEDVKAAIARVVGFHPDAPIIRAYNEMAMMMGGMVHSRILLKQCIVVTFGILPNAYVIANGRWAETLLSESWGEATG